MKKLGVLTLFILIMFSTTSWAQSFYNFSRQRDVIVSLGSGFTSYFGDLNDPGDIFDTRWNIDLGLEYFVSDRISVRGEIMYFTLKGDDASSSDEGRVRRNLSFSSNNGEFNVVGIFNLRRNGRRFYQRPGVNAYLFGGIGLAYFNPRGEVPDVYIDDSNNAIPLADAGEKISLQPLMTEGEDYNRVTMVIPFGGGIRIKAGPYFNIALEGGYRLAFTDYMDDVSTVYQDQNSFGDNFTARAMADRRPEIGLERLDPGAKRGDPGDNDGYMVYNIKLEFYLPAHILSTSKFANKRRGFRKAKGR